MSIIPASGKPIDLAISEIKTAQDADRAILWLNTVLSDIDQQIEDRKNSPLITEWLPKARAAQRATLNLRHRVLELRDSFKGESALHSSFMRNSLKTLDQTTFQKIYNLMVDEDPALAGLMVIPSLNKKADAA